MTLCYWVGDPLVLCSYGTLSHGTYSSVDTATLADSVGLISVLAVCQPLLVSHPCAALFTSTMLRRTLGDDHSLIKYLVTTLGVARNWVLAPTIYGLRPLNQLGLGWEHKQNHVLGAACDTFVWQPAPLPAGKKGGKSVVAPLPRLADSQEIVSCLKTLARALDETTLRPPGRCGLKMNNTLTLLHVLRGLSERAVGVLPPGINKMPPEERWRAVAEHTAKLCSLPPNVRLQWDALICWCFGGSNESEGEGQELGAESALEGVWPVDATPQFAEDIAAGSPQHPVLQCKIVPPPGPGAYARMKDMSWREMTMELTQQQSRLDVVGFDASTMQARCLLPPTVHPITAIMLVDSKDASAEVMTTQNSMLVQALGQPSVRSRPPPRLAGAAWIAAEQAALAAEVSILGDFRVLRAIESNFFMHYVLETHKKTEGGGSGAAKSKVLRMAFEVNSATGDTTTRSIEIKLLNPAATGRLALGYPTREDGSTGQILPRTSATGSSGATVIELKLDKLDIWPGDGEVLGYIAVEDLAAATVLSTQAHMRCMFPEEGSAAANSIGQCTNFIALRNAFQLIFNHSAHQGFVVYSIVTDEGVARDGEGVLPMLTLLVHSVRQLPDGRPIAVLCWLDHARMPQVHATRQRLYDTMQEYNVQTVSRLTCSEDQLGLLQELLAQNSQRLVPAKWQKELVERGGAGFCASYLAPLYSGEFNCYYCYRFFV